MMVSFKKATTDDIDSIIELAELAWKPTYAKINSQEQNEYMFAIWYSHSGLENQMKDGQTFWLLQLDGCSIGYASYSFVNEGIYQLNKIYILPEHKGNGYGKQFLKFIESKIVELGSSKLQLNVNRNNLAIRFYETCDYKIIEEVDIPFGDYWMNDFVMEKSL